MANKTPIKSRTGATSILTPNLTSILASRLPAQGMRHHHLLATSNTARTCAHDFASEVARDDVAPAFRTRISVDGRDEVILWTDIRTHHVMEHGKELQTFGATRRAYGLIRFNLHRVAVRARCVASFNKAPTFGPARPQCARKPLCSACGRQPTSLAAAATRPDRSGRARSGSHDGLARRAAAARPRTQRIPAGSRRSFRECAGYRPAR